MFWFWFLRGREGVEYDDLEKKSDAAAGSVECRGGLEGVCSRIRTNVRSGRRSSARTMADTL
ncbi:hypothetical protein L210DRAFT_3533404 [Boletus edulis BED1]|uniref:Uncharacterized protein n=1 Tax=Boletus edulis BED1 TaxID=1328754 RepID=A0AAD4C012_BOLED|nr:hypothetical protein L210DRAFT_3576931 [Boletus edulis BED1]KAF8443992.1 hypothetical protein L210DRAFT_3533404 [Boletus edulis BED1]